MTDRPVTIYATETEYRVALHAAQRALMHASKRLHDSDPQVRILIDDALTEVNRVLDIGRDENNEQVAT